MPTCPRSSFTLRAVLTAAFACSLLLFGCRDGASAGGAAEGTKASFRMKTLEGGRSLGPTDFPGQVVVVDFWATWCGPCHVQARILEPIYQDYQGKGVQFLAANVGEEAETVRRFLQSKPLPYTVLIDPGDVAGELGVFALPTLMVVDKKGRVAFFESGIVDGPTLRRVLKEAGAA